MAHAVLLATASPGGAAKREKSCSKNKNSGFILSLERTRRLLCRCNISVAVSPREFSSSISEGTEVGLPRKQKPALYSNCSVCYTLDSSSKTQEATCGVWLGSCCLTFTTQVEHEQSSLAQPATPPPMGLYINRLRKMLRLM